MQPAPEPPSNVIPLRHAGNEPGGWRADSSCVQAAGFVHRARLLWKTSFDALAVVDDERRYRRINPATAELFGTDVTAIIGARIEDFTPSELWPVLERLWGDLRQQGTLEGPYEMMRRDGVRALIEFRATCDFAPGEHLIAAREIVRGAPPARCAEHGARGRPRLTPRECEVLQLAADGAASTREIAEILVVSPGTVKTHFENAYRKLEVTDRASAVAAALRAGLID